MEILARVAVLYVVFGVFLWVAGYTLVAQLPQLMLWGVLASLLGFLIGVAGSVLLIGATVAWLINKVL